MKGDDISYWRPQVMRHTLPDGVVEYAIHEVYFDQHDNPNTYTVDALSPRVGSVAELEAWLRAVLNSGIAEVVCGDLGYAYSVEEDLNLWVEHIHDSPIDYAAEEGNDT